MFSKSEIRMSNIETSTNVQSSKGSLVFEYSSFEIVSKFGFRVSSFRGDLSPRGLFALTGLSRGGFDPKDGFAVFHQIEPVAGDRFQINCIGFQQIHFAGLLGKQRLLFVTLGLEIVDLGVTDLQFLIRRDEKADDHEPNCKEEKSQEDTVPTLPNGSFATRAEICVIHFQRILPP
jgi:hypothetical protein